MKRIMSYEIESGLWAMSLASDNIKLSAGELNADVIIADITRWSDERITQFASQDKEAQLSDLESLEFQVFVHEMSMR